MNRIRGLIIAETTISAQKNLDKLCRALAVPLVRADIHYVIATPKTAGYVCRGAQIPNRVLVFDGIELTKEQKDALVPCFDSEEGLLNVQRITFERAEAL